MVLLLILIIIIINNTVERPAAAAEAARAREVLEGAIVACADERKKCGVGWTRRPGAQELVPGAEGVRAESLFVLLLLSALIV